MQKAQRMLRRTKPTMEESFWGELGIPGTASVEEIRDLTQVITQKRRLGLGGSRQNGDCVLAHEVGRKSIGENSRGTGRQLEHMKFFFIAL